MFHSHVPETSMVSKKRFQKCLETDATLQLDFVSETPVESMNPRKKNSIQSDVCGSVNDESSFFKDKEAKTLKKRNPVKRDTVLDPSNHRVANLGADQIQELHSACVSLNVQTETCSVVAHVAANALQSQSSNDIFDSIEATLMNLSDKLETSGSFQGMENIHRSLVYLLGIDFFNSRLGLQKFSNLLTLLKQLHRHFNYWFGAHLVNRYVKIVGETQR